MPYTLKNSKGFFLKYNLKTTLVFNGDKKDRKEIIYKVNTEKAANKLLNKAKSFGMNDISIQYISDNEEIEEILQEENYDPYYLFKELNKKCLSCVHSCKQSSVVQIIKCPDYKEA